MAERQGAFVTDASLLTHCRERDGERRIGISTSARAGVKGPPAELVYAHNCKGGTIMQG